MLQFALILQVVLSKDVSSDEEGWIRFTTVDGIIKVGNANLDEQLFAYVSAGVGASVSFNQIGFATDKASPCSGNITNSAVSLPDNTLIVCAPQVVCGEVVLIHAQIARREVSFRKK